MQQLLTAQESGFEGGLYKVTVAFLKSSKTKRPTIDKHLKSKKTNELDI